MSIIIRGQDFGLDINELAEIISNNPVIVGTGGEDIYLDLQRIDEGSSQTERSVNTYIVKKKFQNDEDKLRKLRKMSVLRTSCRECPICLEAIKKQFVLECPVCSNLFHSEDPSNSTNLYSGCLLRYFKKYGNNCPMCRSNILEEYEKISSNILKKYFSKFINLLCISKIRKKFEEDTKKSKDRRNRKKSRQKLFFDYRSNVYKKYEVKKVHGGKVYKKNKIPKGNMLGKHNI